MSKCSFCLVVPAVCTVCMFLFLSSVLCLTNRNKFKTVELKSQVLENASTENVSTKQEFMQGRKMQVLGT